MQRPGDVPGSLALGLLTFTVFSSALQAEFLNWDDPQLLLNNRAVLQLDLTLILSQWTLGIYHPLTLLSLALEHRLAGLEPFLYHFDNILLHAANAALVALFLRRALRDGTWLPWLCAALFAVHPLHVESVAWVAERKDLLSTFFILLTLCCYVSYCRSKRLRAWGSALLFFALALLSKPMAVTVPVLMLALDHREGRADWKRIAVEKIPFLLLALLAGLLSLQTQSSLQGQTQAIYTLDLPGRLWLALQSLVFYVSKTLLPLRLSAYYDADLVHVEWYQYTLALPLLAAMLYAALARPGRDNDARFGTLFFLITLAPVLKILPFGGNSIFNDRYMYLPSVGLFLAFALPFRSALSLSKGARMALASLWTLALLALSLQSFQRAKLWRDSEAFWQGVLDAYPGTSIALTHLGRFYFDERGDVTRSLELFSRAARARPESYLPQFNLGLVHEQRGELERAEAHLREAAKLNPSQPEIRLALAIVQLQRGHPEGAAASCQAALLLRPRFAEAEHMLGVALLELGDRQGATGAFQRARQLGAEIDPEVLSGRQGPAR